MIGYRFSEFVPDKDPQKSAFENLLKIFMQLLVITSGDVGESLNWLNNVDRQYKITEDDYGMGDFIEDLKRKGYISEDPVSGEITITAKRLSEDY